MKKYILALIISLVSVCSFAQVKGDKAVGLNISYGTEISNIGIGVKGQYNFTDAIRAEAAFDYFLKKDGMSMWDINLNAHYLFPVAEKIKVYPLVGLTYTNWKLSFSDDDVSMSEYPWSNEYSNGGEDSDDSSSTGKFGVNLGCGVSYDITDKLAINAEVKYQLISDFNQAVFSVGVAYKF